MTPLPPPGEWNIDAERILHNITKYIQDNII